MSDNHTNKLTWNAVLHAEHDNGIALILVLGFVAVCAIITSHLMSSSVIIARESKVVTERQRLKYEAESYAARAFWLYHADRKRFTNRMLGVPREAGMDESQESWMADAKPHHFERPQDATKVIVALHDANQGLDISGRKAVSEIRERLEGPEDGTDQQIAVREFIDVLKDYIDPNDLTPLYGMEQPQYADLGWPDLPRNAPFQRREEILWLRNVKILIGTTAEDRNVNGTRILNEIRIIPPKGMRFPGNDKPSFFSASPGAIQQVLDLDEYELERVMEARKEFWQTGEDFRSLMDADLYARLRQRFSFRESGIITVTVTASNPEMGIRRHLSLTRDCRRLPRSDRDFIRYWDARLP